MSKRKYERGSKFLTITELVHWLEHDNPVYIGTKIWVAKWVVNLQLQCLLNDLERGCIYKAIRKDMYSKEDIDSEF